MEATAFSLDLLLGVSAPVVLTGVRQAVRMRATWVSWSA
jgi:L-asparaginase/Glu-tRNA(Gln) amidotransferase subunit D